MDPLCITLEVPFSVFRIKEVTDSRLRCQKKKYREFLRY